jgi:hypothetical protein
MPKPQDASRPLARPSKQAADDRKPPSATWVRPERAPLQSGMLQNRKLDMPKVKRAVSSRR